MIKQKPKAKAKRNSRSPYSQGKGYRDIKPLPETQFIPMENEKTARASVRLLQAEGKSARAVKRGGIAGFGGQWGVERPQGLEIGAWKRNGSPEVEAFNAGKLLATGKGRVSSFALADAAEAQASRFSGALRARVMRDFIAGYNAGLRTKANPDADAADMFTAFHGQEPTETVEFFENTHYHSNLAALGILISLKIKAVNGGTTEIKFPRGTMPNPLPGGMSLTDYLFPNRKYVHVKTYPTEIAAQMALGKLEDKGSAGRVDRVGRLPGKYKWELWGLREPKGKTANGKKGKVKQGPFGAAAKLIGSTGEYLDGELGSVLNPADKESTTTFLCSNEDGTQLYIIGGDQSVDLSRLGITGPQAKKEKVELGRVTNITYHTQKVFGSKAEEFDYVHEFSEDSHGPRPILSYDRLNERLSLVGGVYFIEKPLLSTSPGIED